MNNKLVIGLFLGAALIQILFPLSMIMKRESVLQHGEAFKFRTAPVDPYDAFRGRYVALRIENDFVPLPNGGILSRGEDVYAIISVDEDGFARFTSIGPEKPKEAPYIHTRINYISGDQKAHLDIPFDRYYMEETSATKAEQVYREHSRSDQQDAYVLVRIKNGFAVIEKLVVAGKPIEEAVKDRGR